ncbi:hypothetical protein K458DRAFT_401982 [Lentithecium fluviatile CBS 122367]|uniref:Uncharacterized protein n=1 Tax=Lentithecium fluviatile CBS 122367 TaxID=1168545 RepID=A0A6G1JBD5_9PLEO|nr:hypothetical protein K458DRAFT_401982 [Lentithecium fluviatile CBS 122367]
MKRTFRILVIVVQAEWIHGQDTAFTFKEKAITPTASGQIGINPVSVYPPESYQNVGPNTQWYQTEGGTTKWIGVNTEYLTDLPYTTTVDNQPSTTTIPAPIVAVTATASQAGTEPGDVSVAFSPKLLEVLNKLASEAEAACGAKRRRTSCDVNQRFAQSVAEQARPGGALDFIDAGIESMLPTVTAADVAAVMNAANVAGGLVGIAITWKLLGKLPAMTLSHASLHTNGSNDENKCSADAPTGDDAPFCTDEECKGDNTKRDQKCAEGKYKGCDCLATAEVVGPIDADMTIYDFGLTWMEEQQKLIQDLNDEASKAPTPSAKSKALSVIFQNYGDESNYINLWIFITTDIGVSAMCRNSTEAVSVQKAPNDLNLVKNPPWPGGTFEMTIEGLGDCEYKNDGSNTGALWCSGRGISCQEDDLRQSGQAQFCPNLDIWGFSHHPVVFCEW